MKPTIQLASTTTPDGMTMVLSQHDRDFAISIGTRLLMTSREHESEKQLASLGCFKIKARPAPRVLIGGLGMGFTLRQALDILPRNASVVVAEFLPDVISWNREFLGVLNGYPLRDRRVIVHEGDVRELIQKSDAAFDAIVLDVDNGPNAMTHESNQWLYGAEGIRAIMSALSTGGCFAVWSVALDAPYEKRLSREHLAFRRFRASNHKGQKSRSRCIWVAAQNARSLPPVDKPRTLNAEQSAILPRRSARTNGVDSDS